VVKLYKRGLDTDKNFLFNINFDKNSPPNIDPPANITPSIDTTDDSNYNDEVDDFLPRFQPPPIKQERGYSKDLKNRLKITPTTAFIINKEKVDMELIY
jgi:hypothetical protein